MRPAASRSRFTTPDEAIGAFDLAEFLQEDPTSSAHRALPYPRLSGGHFRQLQVNNATPPRGRLLSQWMSNQRGYVAPSRLAGDAFTLHPTKLTAAVARYLRLVAPTDLALQSYGSAIAGWTASDAAVGGRRGVGDVRPDPADEHPLLLHGPWPPRARTAIDTEVARLRALVRIVAVAAASPDLIRWRLGYRRAATSVGIAGQGVRRRLHGPAYNL